MVSDANKAFIQAFLARRILTLEEAKPILAAILTGKLLDLYDLALPLPRSRSSSLYSASFTLFPSTKISPSLWPTKSRRQRKYPQQLHCHS